MRLRQRVARLEAAECVRSTVVQYIYLLDAGRVDELVDLFTPNAEFTAENEPGGTGLRASATGRDQIRAHFTNLPFGYFRHHLTNTTVNVVASAASATLTSYFNTTFPQGIQGGVYEGELVRGRDGQWRITTWQVTSSWGWRAGDEAFAYFEELPALTKRDGRPAIWDDEAPRHLRGRGRGRGGPAPRAAGRGPRVVSVPDGMTLDRVLDNLPAALDPARARGVHKTVQLDGTTPRYVIVEEGACHVHHGSAPNPSVRLTATDEDLLELMLGVTSPAKAFFKGRLKVEGDTLFAQALLTLFDRSTLVDGLPK